MLENLKKLILAWDPEYTKVTPLERKEIDEAEKKFYQAIRFLMML